MHEEESNEKSKRIESFPGATLYVDGGEKKASHVSSYLSNCRHHMLWVLHKSKFDLKSQLLD